MELCFAYDLVSICTWHIKEARIAENVSITITSFPRKRDQRRQEAEANIDLVSMAQRANCTMQFVIQ
jgi:hypothetical protein